MTCEEFPDTFNDDQSFDANREIMMDNDDASVNDPLEQPFKIVLSVSSGSIEPLRENLDLKAQKN